MNLGSITRSYFQAKCMIDSDNSVLQFAVHLYHICQPSTKGQRNPSQWLMCCQCVTGNAAGRVLLSSSFSVAFCSLLCDCCHHNQGNTQGLPGRLAHWRDGEVLQLFCPFHQQTFQSTVFFCGGLQYDHCNRITTAVSLEQNTTHFELQSSVSR